MGKKQKTPPPFFATGGTWHTHFIPLFDDMLDSKAYIGLSATSKEAYIILRQEYRGPVKGNNIICPYSTFAAKGMRSNTVSRALVQLQVFGFIEYESGGLAHKPNVYHLSDGWKKIRTDEDLAEAKRLFKLEIDKKSMGTPYKEAM